MDSHGPGVATPPSAWPTGRLLSAAARRVERSWDDYLQRWSLTHASLPLLAVLAGGPRSQREIADSLGVSEQAVSRMAVGLERAGYLQRRRHGGDRRRQVVAITDHGRETLTTLDDPGAVEAIATAALSPAEVAELRRLLVLVLDPSAARDRPGDE